MKKVLDTNVILHDPHCLSKIQGTLYLTSTVLGELDSFKKSNNELSRNVREFTRLLKEANNVKFYEYLMVDVDDVKTDNDYRIIKSAKDLEATLVTNDLLMSFRAIAEGVEVEEHKDSKKTHTESFTGIIEGNPLSLDVSELFPNQYINGRSGKIERFTGTDFIGLGKDKSVWGLKHKNLEQRCAIDAMMDDSIHLVTISGKAGTGKTLLALACALEKTITENKYNKISVARPVIPMGNDIGYLPGDLSEKLGPWMQPIIDNIEFLFQKDNQNFKAYEELESQGIIKVEPLMYIRGRSIPNQFIIIDEAQNLTKHEVKTIISRAGEGTKIILTGDPDQIDASKLDSVNNGLSYVIEKFKDQSIAAHITLTKGERSKLADIATEIL